MKKLLIILAMIFIGCSESGNSVSALDFDPTDVENDSTEIDSIVTIDTIDTIDSVKETKDTIINTKKNKEESSNSNEVTSSSSTKKDTVVVSSSSSSSSSSSKVEDKSSSSINVKKEESSSSMEKKNESSSSEKVVLSSSSSSEKLVESSSSELIVSSSSEKKVESSSSKIVESSSSEKIVNSSSSDNDDYIDKYEPKNTIHTYVELDELKLNGFRVENNIAYLSWENNTNFTMQINVTYGIGCNLVGVTDSTIIYTIKANSVKEKAIYEIKNDAQKCVGYVKTLTATENDKSNFAGWRWGSDRGMKYITFRN